MSGVVRPEVAALLEFARASGISPDELQAAARASSQPSMTVAGLMQSVEAATTAGARLTYRPYWKQLVEELGDVALKDVRTSQLRALALRSKERAVRRSNSRNGVSAQENCVGALRCFFRVAVEDGFISKNPADDVKKPRRAASRRRGFSDEQLVDLYRVTAEGGDDPMLDTLLLRFHLETGARRGGALALRLQDVSVARQCVLLREKNDTERWQPISKTLLDALLAHAAARGATSEGEAVFRRLPRCGAPVGLPVTRRRYNTLVTRWRSELEWVRELGVSIHWCRHHATSSVERLAGYAVARAFAGHAEGDDVTTTYIKAHEHEVARAVAVYTGEPHPMAE